MACHQLRDLVIFWGDNILSELHVCHLGYTVVSGFHISNKAQSMARPIDNIVICFVLFQCLFASSLKRFSLRDWSIEQKWMSLLLPLLLLYDGKFIELKGTGYTW